MERIPSSLVDALELNDQDVEVVLSVQDTLNNLNSRCQAAIVALVLGTAVSMAEAALETQPHPIQ